LERLSRLLALEPPPFLCAMDYSPSFIIKPG
jgi:hypothetical protein